MPDRLVQAEVCGPYRELASIVIMIVLNYYGQISLEKLHELHQSEIQCLDSDSCSSVVAVPIGVTVAAARSHRGV